MHLGSVIVRSGILVGEINPSKLRPDYESDKEWPLIG